MTKTGWFILFLLLFATLGYCREFFFVHLNIIMYEKYYHSVSPAPFPPVMVFFKQFSYNTLYYLKYLFTFLWALLFFGTNYLALKKLIGTPFFLKLLFYTYLCMALIAGISMAYGYFINGSLQDDEYTLSRWLLGIAQSPIICLILVASEKLYNKSYPS